MTLYLDHDSTIRFGDADELGEYRITSIHGGQMMQYSLIKNRIKTVRFLKDL